MDCKVFERVEVILVFVCRVGLSVCVVCVCLFQVKHSCPIRVRCDGIPVLVPVLFCSFPFRSVPPLIWSGSIQHSAT